MCGKGGGVGIIVHFGSQCYKISCKMEKKRLKPSPHCTIKRVPCVHSTSSFIPTGSTRSQYTRFQAAHVNEHTCGFIADVCY